MNPESLDPATPVVIGAAELVRRPDSEFDPTNATALLIETVGAAFATTGVGDALVGGGGGAGPRIGSIAVPHGTWSESDPARAVAEAFGAPGARTIRSELGVLQYTLVARAIADVMAGSVEVAVVVGGENRWSMVDASRSGREVPAPPPAAEGEPDEILVPTEMVISPLEIERNLTTAAHQYAIIESALRHRLGHDIEQHRAELGRLWSAFSAVAADAPAAWDRRALSPDDITVVGDRNRLIAAPYAKWLVSQWNVDQAAAVVISTVAVARELGVPTERWIFPLALAHSELVVPLPERAELDRWPAAAEAARAVFAASGVSAHELATVDLYSCFPSAVEVQAREFGLDARLDDPGSLTLTGGMTFGGGPFNNYSLQGIAATIRTLRARSGAPGSVGLTSAVSGLLTKSAVALWSTAPPRSRFETIDVTAAADAATARRPVDGDLVGAVTVVGATVVPGPEGPTSIAVVESPAGVRSVAQCADAAVAERFTGDDPVGSTVEVVTPGVFMAN